MHTDANEEPFWCIKWDSYGIKKQEEISQPGRKPGRESFSQVIWPGAPWRMGHVIHKNLVILSVLEYTAHCSCDSELYVNLLTVQKQYNTITYAFVTCKSSHIVDLTRRTYHV